MIVIFSIAGDQATSEVIRWLRHLGSDQILRINEEDARKGCFRLSMSASGFTLRSDGVDVRLEEIKAVWYRKGDFQLTGAPALFPVAGHDALAESLQRKVKSESDRINEYFHHLLAKSARLLGNPRMSRLNKLVVLDAAREVGFAVPEFVASNERDAFLSMLDDGSGAITKAASDGIYLWDYDIAGRGYYSYTERLTRDALDILPARIPLSFAQKEIAKKFELRIFFLDGAIYPMAILSQGDEQTRLDYRKYNYERPNRNVPYELPDEISDKAVRLFRKLDLNTGSIDMIVDEDGEYVFLEVNPAGQYGGLSSSCNYNLNKKIALWLMGDHEDRIVSS